ncbi:8-oxoguanine glycosylase ogg1 [Mortierella claussenii]|nr:8-oxoguanine glycosylase ogg1 [Mortierella claussenii]
MMAAMTRTTRKRALSVAKESVSTSTSTIVATTTRVRQSKAFVSTVVTKTRTTTASRKKTAATVPSAAETEDPVAKTTESSKPKLMSKAKLTAPEHVRSTPWVTMRIPRSELDLSTTLKCGQSFRWQREHRELDSGQISLPMYSCVLDHRLWCIQETENGLKYRTFRSAASSVQGAQPCPQTGVMATDRTSENNHSGEVEEERRQDEAFLKDYFQLDVPLTELYTKWSNLDANFRAKAHFFPGVRILRQDPVENLICFICSSNNNISRISQMAIKLCQKYGSPITIPAQEADESPKTYYGFPTMDALAQEGVEETLRQMGFGYRAKYIANTAKMISKMENGEEWLMGLRKLPYEEAHASLLTLQGVGPKVADCVCLMSLDKHDSIPVDTHVWQIAVRDYKFRFEGKVPKTISPAIYKAVGKHFVDLFGTYSGWAHSVLFAADLRTIEGRAKEGPDSGLVSIKVEETVELPATSFLSAVVKEEEETLKSQLTITKGQEEEKKSIAVSQGVRGVKLEEDSRNTLGSSTSRHRQAKRRFSRGGPIN